MLIPCRAIGQMLIMGWDGTEVTPQIRKLIENHHLGSSPPEELPELPPPRFIPQTLLNTNLNFP